MTNQTHSRRSLLIALGSAFALGACSRAPMDLFDTGPLGDAVLDPEGNFGQATRNNIGVHNGDIEWAHILSERFAAEVPTTINFAFNSDQLDGAARSVLTQQASFIRNFPEVRFSVYGHTDAVGSNSYNTRLGRRRAQAAVSFLVSQGVSRHRLQALVSLGESQPVIATDGEEPRNRRTVTEVSGFVGTDPLVMDGRYAAIVYRGYRDGMVGATGGDS